MCAISAADAWSGFCSVVSQRWYTFSALGAYSTYQEKKGNFMSYSVTCRAYTDLKVQKKVTLDLLWIRRSL